MAKDSSQWDAVVVGAGPAGGLSSLLLARRGWKVLLVEKSAWPREKVCGGCINSSAIATLREAGLNQILAGEDRTRAASFILESKRALEVSSDGVAMPRAELDRRLVKAAQAAGVEFRPNTAAHLSAVPAADKRSLTLRQERESATISANVVLACDGIGGTLLRDEPWARWTVSGSSYLGVACTLEPGQIAVGRHRVHMFLGSGGYVGLVRFASGAVHLGAAVHPQACKELGGPVKVVEQILQANGIDVAVPRQLKGTPLLTRRRSALGGHRTLCVGDACGYVEPITGQGIAWALQSAKACVELLPTDPKEWPVNLATEWTRQHRTLIGAQQRRCHWVRHAARQPLLWKLAGAVISRVPVISEHLAGSRTPRWAGDVHD